MTYDVILTHSFKRSLKKLEKRYRSVKKDVKIAVEVLLENPELGVEIQGDPSVRKLRLKNSDLQRGKSGGYRLIYCYEADEKNWMCLLLIYAKSDQADVSENELKILLEELDATSKKTDLE